MTVVEGSIRATEIYELRRLRRVNAVGVFLSGVLPEEGSPPPSSTPDIIYCEATQPGGLAFFFGHFNSKLRRTVKKAIGLGGAIIGAPDIGGHTHGK
jgi:hypothetical protein